MIGNVGGPRFEKLVSCNSVNVIKLSVLTMWKIASSSAYEEESIAQ
jgi:hypothetical protein